MFIRMLFFIAITNVYFVHAEGSEIDSFQNKAELAQGYAKIFMAIGLKACSFFSRDIQNYDLQRDVLNHYAKKVLYESFQDIETLLNDANRHDNPIVQIRALILLCRVSVPGWYIKSFQKGLDKVIADCFDDQGNFIKIGYKEDIKIIFRDYYRKIPLSWHDIACISDWWFRNNKYQPLQTKYFAFSCTKHNEDLLAIVQAAEQYDKIFLQYLVCKNQSEIAYKIYDYYILEEIKRNALTRNARD